MTKFHNDVIREKFPLLSKKIYQKPLVYFDNAATAQKPASVLAAEDKYYRAQNANVHRASHGLSAEATMAYENARKCVQSFINAPESQSVIWTSGTTAAINLVAQSWGAENIGKGDEILLTQAEHHANIVPWQMLAEKQGAVIKVVNLDDNGLIDLAHLESLLSAQTRICCVHHVSNVIGKYNDIKKITKLVHQSGVKLLVDGAQAIAHQLVDVQSLDCDFYVFSAHKAYGPTGVGVLYGKKSLLDDMKPVIGGGEMIKKVSFETVSFNDLPFKFEAGTPNIAGNIAFAQALNFITEHRQQLELQEQVLTEYAYQKLCQIKGLNWLTYTQPDIGIFSFTIDNVHNQDLASYLDTQGIAIRSGHHCAMPLMAYFNIEGCLRVSILAYNTRDEIDFLVAAITRFISGDAPHNEPLLQQSAEIAAEPPKSEQQWQLTQAAQQVLARFEQAKSWDLRHRQLMLLGKEYKRMDKQLRSEQNLIEGCESKAWLNLSFAENSELVITGDSDAKIIRGLLHLVSAAYQGLNAKQVVAFDIDQYFKELGLLAQLSPSRGNGLKAIVQAITSYAQQHLP